MMTWYAERIVPRIVNKTCGIEVLVPLRRRVCSGLSGRVVELGFGSGLNVPLYPDSIERVAAVEPSDLAWQLATERVAASRIPVERSGLDGQRLPFGDDEFDNALSTWTMCSIPDLRAALTEVRRVLRPGGTLHFVEHGLAPDLSVVRWQRRLEPFQRALCGGCHLTRPIADLVSQAGFTVDEIDEFYQPGSPRALAALTVGRAVVT